MNPEYEFILFAESGPVARLTLNRPPYNVLTITMIKEMNAALESLLGDESVKVLVIGAEGKHFSAGVDVADHTADKVDEMIHSIHRTFHLLGELDIPTVAVVDGLALGGGCELALFCDLVIATERAKFGQPEIKVGVFPPVAAVLLPRITGYKQAFELLLTGENFDARQAESAGLVNRVVPLEELEQTVQDLIAKLTALSGAVLRLTKRAAVQGLDKPFWDALAASERLYLEELMRTEDAHEGLAAFMQKRPPVWKDR